MASAPAGKKGVEASGSAVLAHPDEIADPLNLHIYHPLARRLAGLLRPTGISPNAVSVVSGLTVVAAALCYVGLSPPLSVALGFALHLSWHVVDGADGALARLTGRSSPFGELVDGVADYASHFILYTLIALVLLAPEMGLLGCAIVLAAGLSRIAQSNHAETQRRVYLWRVYGVPWLKQAEASGDELFERRGLIATIFVGWIARGYIRLASATNPRSAEIDAALEAAAGNEKETARLRRLFRQFSRKSLLFQLALGANPRTILLGLCMAIGSPLAYFLIEAVALNLVLIASILHQVRCNRAIVAGLDGASPPLQRA